MSGSCACKLKTGFVCEDRVEMCEGLWRDEEKINELVFVNQARCKYHDDMKLPDGFTIRSALAGNFGSIFFAPRSTSALPLEPI